MSWTFKESVYNVSLWLDFQARCLKLVYISTPTWTKAWLLHLPCFNMFQHVWALTVSNFRSGNWKYCATSACSGLRLNPDFCHLWCTCTCIMSMPANWALKIKRRKSKCQLAEGIAGVTSAKCSEVETMADTLKCKGVCGLSGQSLLRTSSPMPAAWQKTTLFQAVQSYVTICILSKKLKQICHGKSRKSGHKDKKQVQVVWRLQCETHVTLG